MDVVKKRALAFLSGAHHRLGSSSPLMTLSPYIVQTIAMMYMLSEHRLRLIVGRGGRIDIVNPYTGNRRTLYEYSGSEQFPEHSLLAINGHVIPLVQDVIPIGYNNVRRTTILEYIDTDNDNDNDTEGTFHPFGGKIYSMVTDKLQWYPCNSMIYLPSRMIVMFSNDVSTGMITVLFMHIPTESIYSTSCKGIRIGSVGISKTEVVVASLDRPDTLYFTIVQPNKSPIVMTVKCVGERYAAGELQNIGDDIVALVTYPRTIRKSNVIIYLCDCRHGKTASVSVSAHSSEWMVDKFRFICSSAFIVLWETMYNNKPTKYRLVLYNAWTGNILCSTELGVFFPAHSEKQLPSFRGKTKNAVFVSVNDTMRVFTISPKDMMLSDTCPLEHIGDRIVFSTDNDTDSSVFYFCEEEDINLSWPECTLLCPGSCSMKCVRRVCVFDGIEITRPIDVSYGTGPAIVYMIL